MKDFTILHISDLHRNKDGYVANNQLLVSLIQDSEEYIRLYGIPKPSIVIVSGDMIFGSSNPDVIDSSTEIRRQYVEAREFLEAVAKEFANGDKERIVIIPGNHDVHWAMSKASMTKIDSLNLDSSQIESYTQALKDPIKNIRWSWKDLSFFEITDTSKYNSRLNLFSEFYRDFYDGKRYFSLDPEKQFDTFEIASHNLGIVAYNSCFRNDHLNQSGLINSRCLSDSFYSLSKFKEKNRLTMAVWHHNVTGLPHESAYLDPRQIKKLTSYGLSVGFHGHQHLSDVAENVLQFDSDRKMVLISAGTLCSARSHLPTGFKRQYNVVRISQSDPRCILYSRETHGNMDDTPIWDKGRINESMNSSLELDIKVPQLVVSNKQIDILTTLMRGGDPDTFLAQINPASTNNSLIRSMLIEFDGLTHGTHRTEICGLLERPVQNNFDEYYAFLEHYLTMGDKSGFSDLYAKAIEDFKDKIMLMEQLKKLKTRFDGYK